jgi:ABC-type branched-subunit amino acid transport system permease subunit
VRGPYFGLVTLVAVLLLQNFVVVFSDLTGGEIGLTVPDVISASDRVNYWIALGFMTFRRADKTRFKRGRSASTSPNTSSPASSSRRSSQASRAR